MHCLSDSGDVLYYTVAEQRSNTAPDHCDSTLTSGDQDVAVIDEVF